MAEVEAGAARFKTKRRLTRPVLKFQEGVPQYIRIEKAMYIGREMKPGTDGKKKEPATLADVTELTTGEEAQIICSAVIKSTLEEEYPGAGYVSKCFSITKQAKTPGKQYNKFDITEIEDPASEKSANGDASNRHGRKG